MKKKMLNLSHLVSCQLQGEQYLSLAFSIECSSSLVWRCFLHTGKLVPWVSTGHEQFRGKQFSDPQPYASIFLKLLSVTEEVCSLPPHPSNLLCHGSPSPTSQRMAQLPPIPMLTMIYHHRVKISKALSKMTVQECITSGETLESKAKKTKTKQNKNPQNKTLRSIELVKKKKSIETVFHLGDTPSACRLSAYLSLHLSICLSMFYQS